MNEKNVKVTKRERFAQLLAINEVAQNQDLVDFINHEVELLTRKNSSEKKPTAAQLENEKTAEVVLATLVENGNGMTVTEIIKSNKDLGEFTNQKITAILRNLISADKVERIEDKRKTYFKAK
jgi:hypothetical protein